MKVTVNVDATPEELRRFLGLPDVQPVQEEMMEMIRERMLEGREGYDPATLLKPFLSAQVQGMEGLQKLFWDALRQSTEPAAKGKKKNTGKSGE